MRNKPVMVSRFQQGKEMYGFFSILQLDTLWHIMRYLKKVKTYCRGGGGGGGGGVLFEERKHIDQVFTKYL